MSEIPSELRYTKEHEWIRIDGDNVIVGISDGNQKKFLFPIEDRVKIVSKALYGDLKLPKKKIQVIKFN